MSCGTFIFSSWIYQVRTIKSLKRIIFDFLLKSFGTCCQECHKTQCLDVAALHVLYISGISGRKIVRPLSEWAFISKNPFPPNKDNTTEAHRGSFGEDYSYLTNDVTFITDEQRDTKNNVEKGVRYLFTIMATESKLAAFTNHLKNRSLNAVISLFLHILEFWNMDSYKSSDGVYIFIIFTC